MLQTLFCGIVIAEAVYNHGYVTTIWIVVACGWAAFFVSMWFVREKLFVGAVKNSKGWYVSRLAPYLLAFTP